jgi:hypothetical protein
MFARRTRVALLVLVAGAGLASTGACKRRGATSTESAADADEPEVAAALRQRCVAVGAPFALDVDANEGDAGEALGPRPFAALVGNAVADDRGFWVAVRGAGRDGRPAVVFVPMAPSGASGVPVRVIELPRESLGPPTLAASSDGQLAVVTARNDGSDAREVSVFVTPLAPTPAAPFGAPRTRLNQRVDEIEAIAAAWSARGPMLAWGEAFGDPPAGRIRVIDARAEATAPSAASAAAVSSTSARPAPVASSAKPPAGSKPVAAAPADAMTAAESDATAPALVLAPDRTRALLLFLAERADTDDEKRVERGHEKEGPAAGEPSQADATRWLEAMLIDTSANGGPLVPLGPAKALTRREGHAQTFVARWTADGLFAVVRDDPRPTDGDGGSLHAVVASIGKAQVGEAKVSEIAAQDVSPGEAALVHDDARAPWIVWSALDGSAVLRDDKGERTIEPQLSHARVVSHWKDAVLVSRPRAGGVELAVVRCGS